MAQKRWQWLRFVGNGHPPLFWFLILLILLVIINFMIRNRVTHMHHLMIMGSSVASGPRWQRPVWQLSEP
jgi:hypothetical protein